MTGSGRLKLEHGHTREDIGERLSAGPRHNYLRDVIYGGIDGAVTTFAVVAGVVGAELSTAVVLIMGFANLAADGFSMAASNFLGTRAEREDFEHLEAVERRHIEIVPEGEREEVRQIFRGKGFEGEELERVVTLITADSSRWVRTMLTEEYGLPAEVRSPLKAALATFVAFCLCGLVPLLPYVFGAREAFWLSTLLTGGIFFAIGSAKSRWSTASWWRSGLWTLAVGGLAAALAYAVGGMLRSLGT
ncbi:MAG TPA: VIT1/CCC1 transporter family protein [Pyrinomonadaceae bacterium]